jgi:peptidoglycan/LPS O-acetylase OafA/YrhL
MLFCLAVSFNILHLSWDVRRPAQQWIPAYLDWFAFGMLLAVLATARPDISSLRRLRRTVRGWAAAPGTCWSVAVLLWLLSATQLGTPRDVTAPSFWQWTTEHVLYGLTAFFTVLPAALGRPDRRRVLGSRPAQFLGVTAYGTFLWHLPIMIALQRSFDYRPFSGHFAALVVATVAGAAVCGGLSWFSIERPLLRYGSAPWRGSPATSVIATATTHIV